MKRLPDTKLTGHMCMCVLHHYANPVHNALDIHQVRGVLADSYALDVMISIYFYLVLVSEDTKKAL